MSNLLGLNYFFSVFSEDSQHGLSPERILDVLRFCDKWDAPRVEYYCLNYLDQVVATRKLHPMLAFSLGRKFKRTSWLKDALTRLQEIPVSTWVEDSEILSWMSPHDMIIVLRLREHLHLSRFELICFRPPAVHTDRCKNLQECSFLWDLAWYFNVVPRIAQKGYKSVKVYLFVKEFEVEGMGDGCAKASREAALDSNKFYTDIRGVEKALELIS